MRPIWKKIEAENMALDTEYYDFDERKDIVSKYNIDKGILPVAIFLDLSGNEILRLSGEVTRERILQAIKEFRYR